MVTGELSQVAKVIRQKLNLELLTLHPHFSIFALKESPLIYQKKMASQKRQQTALQTPREMIQLTVFSPSPLLNWRCELHV